MAYGALCGILGAFSEPPCGQALAASLRFKRMELEVHAARFVEHPSGAETDKDMPIFWGKAS